MTTYLTTRRSSRLVSALFLLLVTAVAALAQGTAPATPAKPAGGTTLVDKLKLPSAGQIRTLPLRPRVGVWGLVIGRPDESKKGVGLEIKSNGQAVVYPTTELLTGAVGTIEFNVNVTTPMADGDAPRTLLDSFPNGGPSRISLTLNGKKLTLSFTGENNQTATVDANLGWAQDSQHRIDVVWDAADVTLMLDNGVAGKVEKPNLPGREPLYITLGNNRDFQAPAKMAVSSLRLSTAREPHAPADVNRADDSIQNIEMSIKMAQGYQRRMYPVFDQMRNRNQQESNLAYAIAYFDIGDLDRAMQTVTPIANDQNNPLYVQAVFLRADLLTDQRAYMEAFNQLQALTSSKDTATVVRAQVKQATVLYNQGNKAEAMRLIGDLIARYQDMKEINEAYLLIGKDKFGSGDFDAAFRAFDNVGIPGTPPRQTVAIGTPLQLKVADADLNVRLSDVGLPVTVTVTSGDKETVNLRPAFSRGVYIGSIDTALGEAKPGDKVLQVMGNDTIQVTYIDHLSPDGVDKQRLVGVNLATDAKLAILAQSAVDIFHEAVALQKKNVLDERWEIIADLPEDASDFFRDAETGDLRKKGARIDLASFIGSMKPGQSAYIELNEPDMDTTAKPDETQLEVTGKSGKKVMVALKETGPHTGIFTGLLKTDLAAEAKEGIFGVEASDSLSARYLDAAPSAESRNPAQAARLAIISGTLGKLVCGTTYVDNYKQTIFRNAYRVSNGTPVIVKLEDRDLDASDAKDTIVVTMKPENAPETQVTLNETGPHTGTFTTTVKVVTDAAATGTNLVKATAGDRIVVNYPDAENPTAAMKSVLYVFRANAPEDASMKFFRKIVEKIKTPKLAPGMTAMPAPANTRPPKISYEETTTLVPGYVYELRLTDGDILPRGGDLMTAKAMIKSSNGAWAEVILDGNVDPETLVSTFKGEFFVRLGDKNSPSRAFVSQTGAVVDIKITEDEENRAANAWALPALNIQGKDAVQAVYVEPLAGNGQKDVQRKTDLRVGDDAELTALNAQGNPLEQLKPGMPFELQVKDSCGDLTPKRDAIKATLTSTCGDTLTLDLLETDIHSGTYSAIVNTVYGTKPTADTFLEVPFEGKVTITYQNAQTIAGPPEARTMDLATRPMAEAECLLLTKVYDDPNFEVETLVRLGESLWAVGAAKLATVKAVPGQPRTNVELQESKRLLQRVIDRFPSSEYVVEALFLTGRIFTDEQKYADASALFKRVIDEYPDSDLVPKALLQLVGIALDSDNLDDAVEHATRLVYGYPKNSLVADAVVKIANYYYDKKKDYLTSAGIYKNVVDRFPDAPNIDRIAYRTAIAYYKAGTTNPDKSLEKLAPYGEAAKQYLSFADTYKDSELVDDALYWAASALMKLSNVKAAYKLLTRVVFEMPGVDMLEQATRLRNTIKESYPKIEEDNF